jgi:hypothetical protein
MLTEKAVIGVSLILVYLLQKRHQKLGFAILALLYISLAVFIFATKNYEIAIVINTTLAAVIVLQAVQYETRTIFLLATVLGILSVLLFPTRLIGLINNTSFLSLELFGLGVIKEGYAFISKAK